MLVSVEDKYKLSEDYASMLARLGSYTFTIETALLYCRATLGLRTKKMNLVLAKKGNFFHMHDLLQRGIVHMRRLRYYTDLEDRVRGDENEGLRLYYPRENKSLKVSVTLPNNVVMPIEDSTLRVYNNYDRDCAVFCMYGVPVHPDQQEIPIIQTIYPFMEEPRHRVFGDSLVFFYNTQEFLRLLVKAARQAGYELRHGPVEYKPLDYIGDMHPHIKLAPYAYQQEWRAITDKPLPMGQDFLNLELGSLKEICFLQPP